MTEDLTTKFIDVVPTTILDKAKGLIPALQVNFTVGSHGPYNLKFPNEGYSAQAMKGAVEIYAAEIRKSLS